MKHILRIMAIVFSVLLSLSPLIAQNRPDALVLYRQGNYTEAKDVCLAEIADDPDNIESHVVLSWSLVSLKEYKQAAEWAEKGRKLSRYDPRLIEILAEAQYYQGFNEQALRLFQEYISIAPNGSRTSLVYYFMGEIYLRLAKYRHADMAFSAALQMENLNAPWWVRLGYAREMAKDYRYALEAYNRALDLNSNLQDAIRGRDRATSLLN
ncbi:MAG TPA: tetratricopeptide repeat protein [Treponemataceae bacterium]|nr:tetratricopeptide repeat protein [Treponemataceae bacterium]